MAVGWVEVAIETTADAGELPSLLDGVAMRRRWERDGRLALEFSAADSCEGDQ